jgi:hypothetical protein
MMMMINEDLLDIVDEQWAKLFSHGLMTRHPKAEVYKNFKHFLFSRLVGNGATVPEHWCISEAAAEEDIKMMFILFLEKAYTSEWGRLT